LRKIISILLLTAFVLQVTGTYWIQAAFYLNREYIAANICINRFDRIPVCKGACYLEKELTENAAKQEKSPDLKSVETVLSHPEELVQLPPVLAGELSPEFTFYHTCFYGHLHSQPVFHPPCSLV
jgi:hypothetical protein